MVNCAKQYSWNKEAYNTFKEETWTSTKILRNIQGIIFYQDSVTQSELESIRPDTAGLMASDTSGQVMGVIVTLAGGGSSKYHFMSRYFAPWNGIPEDPVTGRKREIKVLK